MKRLLSIVFAAGVLACGASRSAHAQVVFDNGAPSPASSRELVGAFADDFSFSSSTTIGRVSFFVTDFVGPFDLTGGEFNGQFSWFIFDNSGSNLPGTILESGTAGIGQFSAIDTGIVDNFGANITRIDINVPQFTLAAGTYWFRMREGGLTDPFDTSAIYWQDSVAGVTPNSAFAPTQNDPVWAVNPNVSLAFRLSAPAPEPGAIALALAGLPLLGLIARRRTR
ncbi:MAG: hypothetical protein SFU56_12505 [Capsulimonadales bacterium]|nr:hypothetical protein [Capsulimonadales bacterium]